MGMAMQKQDSGKVISHGRVAMSAALLFTSINQAAVAEFNLFSVVIDHAAFLQFIQQGGHTLAGGGNDTSDIVVREVIVEFDFIALFTAFPVGPVPEETNEPAFSVFEHQVGMTAFEPAELAANVLDKVHGQHCIGLHQLFELGCFKGTDYGIFGKRFGKLIFRYVPIKTYIPENFGGSEDLFDQFIAAIVYFRSLSCLLKAGRCGCRNRLPYKRFRLS
jgi:hypothetical protein